MQTKLEPVRVWDPAIRLFHWTLATLVLVSYASIKQDYTRLHFLSGYAILALLLFRLGWGLYGSDTARFARFVRSPLAAFAHLRKLTTRTTDTEIGHNAAGGYAVLALLLVLLVQVATGLCANDDLTLEGPLSHLLTKRTSGWLTRVHAWNIRLIGAAVAVHVTAIAVYLAKDHNLIGPMLTGDKQLPAGTPAPRIGPMRLAAATLAAASATVWLISRLG